MNRFSEYEKKEILGSRARLLRFEAGEDIERLFNAVRPKYPIRRVVDVLGYNSVMKKYEEVIRKRFEAFDVSSKSSAMKSFRHVWLNDEELQRHIKKRIEMGHIEDEFDFLFKTIDCLANANEVTVAEYHKSWDRVRVVKSKEWAVILNEDGIILTSHKTENVFEPFEEKHKRFGATVERVE